MSNEEILESIEGVAAKMTEAGKEACRLDPVGRAIGPGVMTSAAIVVASEAIVTGNELANRSPERELLLLNVSLILTSAVQDCIDELKKFGAKHD